MAGKRITDESALPYSATLISNPIEEMFQDRSKMREELIYLRALENITPALYAGEVQCLLCDQILDAKGLHPTKPQRPYRIATRSGSSGLLCAGCCKERSLKELEQALLSRLLHED